MYVRVCACMCTYAVRMHVHVWLYVSMCLCVHISITCVCACVCSRVQAPLCPGVTVLSRLQHLAQCPAVPCVEPGLDTLCLWPAKHLNCQEPPGQTRPV